MQPSADTSAAVIVVMGVSGSGKSTVGQQLAHRMGCVFQEGDALHPPHNLRKMKSGVPLDDEDRAPWLAAIRQWITRTLASGQCGVVSCSALRRRYRETLGCNGFNVRVLYLKASPAHLSERLSARRGHFMPAALLQSQINALEEPVHTERAVTVEVDSRDVQSVVDEAVVRLGVSAGAA